MTLGLGFSALGFAPFGTGDIDAAPAPATDNLIDDKGVQRTARAIDPVTRDYVLRASGRAKGVSRATQLVYLRIQTALNSAAISGFGLRETSGDRSAVIDRRVQANLADALSDIVKNGTIALLAVDVNSELPWRQRIKLRWRDLSTGAEESFP